MVSESSQITQRELQMGQLPLSNQRPHLSAALWVCSQRLDVLRRKVCWLTVLEMDLEAQRACPSFTFAPGFWLFVPAYLTEGNWADRFRGMCGHHLWLEDVPGFCWMNGRFPDSQNIRVRKQIEHLLV